MKKCFLLFLLFLFNNKIFSNERMQPWQGEWGDNQQTMNVFVEFVDIPFHSELFRDIQ